VPRADLEKRAIRIVVDSEIDREGLIRRLTEGGYLRVPVVEDPGTLAVRGALLDVWPPSSDFPIRVELYGDLVLSMRSFDAAEQKTLKDSAEHKHLWLPPVREAALDATSVERARARVIDIAEAIDYPTTKTRALVEDIVAGRSFFGAEAFLPAYYDRLDSLFEYLDESALLLIEDPPAVTRALREELARAVREGDLKRRSGPSFSFEALFLDEQEVSRAATRRKTVVLHRLPVMGAPDEGMSAFESLDASATAFDLASSDQLDLTRAVKAARASKGKNAGLGPFVRRLRHWRDHGLRVVVAARAHTQAERLATLLRHQGVACKARAAPFDPSWIEDSSSAAQEVEVVATTSSTSSTASGATRASCTRRRGRDGRSHRHRVRRRRQALSSGLAPQPAREVRRAESAQPKIDRLGGSRSRRPRRASPREVRKMADELLRLYAERQAQPGDALAPADDDYRAFEATFPFDETADQARAIDDVNKDLESDRPMDRLVCGDVGFGKTEVAIRAAFRVAMAGKQVALLCPTTVLAQQHFRTFEARLTGYPMTIRAISASRRRRSRTRPRGLKDGQGRRRHRHAPPPLEGRALQGPRAPRRRRRAALRRAHKERIKQLRAQVDVLTLTATPIPRTLQMAVTGLRDLSLITTPPVDRRAVRTDRHALGRAGRPRGRQRELARGGQVFYVYNRIEGLYEKAQRSRSSSPARIAVGHGQMSRGSTGR
jgi:transcription-repair coupling factor (superfamily II helicase)